MYQICLKYKTNNIMLNLLKFLGKLFLPFIFSYIFLSVIQGFQFNVMSWSILMQRVFTSMSFTFFVITCVYIINED